MLLPKILKVIIQKVGLALTLLPAVLLILGCLIIFITDNLYSFIFTLIIPVLLVLNLIIGGYWLFMKNKFFLFPLIGVIVYCFCFDSFYQFNLSKSTELKKASLKLNTLSILTYNTNGFIHGNDDQDDDNSKVETDDPIVNFIKKTNADVFCIQEFSAIKYKYFRNYPYWYKTNIFTKNKSVMAIFSKYPIIDKGYINFPNSSNGAMYVDLTFNNEIIRVYNVHLESYKTNTIHQLNNPKSSLALIKRIGIAEIIRKDQVILLKNHMDDFQGKTIVCGDFNSTQFASIYGILKGSRKDSFIEAGSGFGSSYKLFSYPFRLDYILVDDSFEVISHQNFEIKLSDHEPVLARLSVN